MITHIDKGIPWDVDSPGQIYFNPVDIKDNQLGRNLFNSLLKNQHPYVFTGWQDYLYGITRKKDILADIQLIQIKHTQKLILNSYVFDNRKLNLLALIKTLVELYNLGVEYELDICIPKKMYCRNPFVLSEIELILKVIFDDYPNNVYIYDSIPNYKN